MDDRLSLSVTHADGRVSRWGPDELAAQDIPDNLEFSTGMPGGFRDLSCDLLRRIDTEYQDQALFDNVTATGPGGRVAWDGRFTQFPRSHGQGFSVRPGAVGWAAHLKDDPSFCEIYVDREMSQWGPMPLNERLRLAVASGIDIGTLSFTNDAGLVMCAAPNQAVGANVDAAAWYIAPAGCTIKHIWYRGARTSWPGTWSAPILRFNVADQFNGGTSQTITPTLDDTLRLATATTARRYVHIEVFTGAAATPAAGANERWTVLAAYGDHGLTTRDIPGEPTGVWASDVIANVVSRAAPLLSTAGVEQTDFAIPQVVFREPVTAEDAILEANKYHLWEWGVYDDRVFFYRPPDRDRLVWEARLSNGANLDLEGDTGEQTFNGVYVSYQDANGQRKTVGPPGASADATNALLADASATNPVNAHGIPRRWAKLDISVPTTELGAIQIGFVWLAEHSLPQRRGSLTLTGSVTHPTEGEVPVWRVRAGDSVRISDHSADVNRRIIETRYNHRARQITLSLENTVFKLEAVLERMGVGLVGVL